MGGERSRENGRKEIADQNYRRVFEDILLQRAAGGSAETWFSSWKGEDLEAAVKSKEHGYSTSLLLQMWEKKRATRKSYQEGFKSQLEQKCEGC